MSETDAIDFHHATERYAKNKKVQNRKNILAVSIAIVNLVRGLRAQCPIMTVKQREKAGPSSRDL